jgi:NitT/TauT family transport system ATP-binding protein
MSNPKVQVENVSHVYASDSGDVLAVQHLNLTLFENEIVCLVGPSGCGKSTLISLVAGFLVPTSGHILINGRPIKGLHSKCGTVFQTDSIFPWMTVEQNVAYGLRFNGTSKSRVRGLVEKYLELTGLPDSARSWPRELSGGMRKRVELARAYAFNPDLLLLDEPFGSLDVMTREEMQVLLLKIWEAERKTIALVTHDVEEAIFLGQRVVVMTPRPGSISQVYEVNFQSSRDPSIKLAPWFVALRHQIVDTLKTPLSSSKST